MAQYQLSNYLFVCEGGAFLGDIGCGAELTIEQARGLQAAIEGARDAGWYAHEPSHWDDNNQWLTLCASCSVRWEQTKARRRAAKVST